MGIKIENGDVVLQQHCADMVKKISEGSYSHTSNNLFSGSVKQFLEYLAASLYVGRVVNRCLAWADPGFVLLCK